MAKQIYQLDYASITPEMYNQISREQKAGRMVKILQSYFGKEKMAELTLLDLGSSTGFIDNILAQHFGKVLGIDIDREAVEFAQKTFKRKNLTFSVGDALKLKFQSNSVDVVICSHIYEHVPSSEKLFLEIYRVLKPSGVCFLASVNKWWPIEPHHKLPFLSWLPKPLANIYIRLTRKEKFYYENLESYWGLKRLTRRFIQLEYTQKILCHPKQFGFDDVLKRGSLQAKIAWLISPLSKFLAPTFFWLLIKGKNISYNQQFEWLPTPTFLYRNYLYRKIAQGLVQGLSKRPQFLDVGAGNGKFLKTLLDMELEGESIDVSSKAVELAKKQFINEKSVYVHLADLLTYHPQKQYDVVFCFEVLEHIPNDLLALKKIFSLLKPGGTLVLSVPAHRSFWSTIDDIKGHYRRYEKIEIIEKISQAGFSINQILTFGFPILSFLRLFSKNGRFVKSKTLHLDKNSRGQESSIQQEYNPRFKILFGNEFLLYPLFKIMDLFTKTDLGFGYIAVCRKGKK